MERIVKVFPAFDKRDPDPKKNYGIHNAEMIFVLKGEHGAVDLILSTGWQLPHVFKEQEKRVVEDIQAGRTQFPFLAVQGRGNSYGVHRNVRSSEYDMERHDCEYTKDGTCYSDVSYMRGEDLFKILVEQGSDGLWTQLEKEYYREFGELR